MAKKRGTNPIQDRKPKLKLGKESTSRAGVKIIQIILITQLHNIPIFATVNRFQHQVEKKMAETSGLVAWQLIPKIMPSILKLIMY